MRPRRVIPVLVVIAAMVFAACGSDSENDSASKEAPDKAGPVKVVFLWEVKGESDVAVDDYNNGAVLAVEQINAAGGIDGRKIETTRISTSVFDMAKANAAYLKALDEKPTAILGFTAPPQISSAVANITRGRVPLIAPTVGGDVLRFGADGGSEFTWLMDFEAASSNAAVDYMTGELGLKKIALMGDNADYGQEGIKAATKALDDAGLEPTTVQSFPPDASDVTRQVLAVKSSAPDGLLNVAYPNPLAVQLKQSVQNGVAVPTFSFGSSPFVVNFKMATGNALKDFYGVEACNFLAAEQANAKKFAADYAKRFPDAGPPAYFAGYTYDMVHIVKAAIEKAGSSDPVKVNDALKDIEVTDGVVCGNRYQADDSHFLRRDGVIVSYGPESPPGKIVKTFEIPLLPKA